MLQPLFDQSTLPLLEKMAVFGERRQQVLAGNIANIDTPNYKVRDLPVAEFERALQQAVARRTRPASLGDAPASPSTAAEEFPADLFRAVESPNAHITFQDGANRNIEQEVMEMTKNSMRQTYAIELMTAQMNLLQAVIAERP